MFASVGSLESDISRQHFCPLECALTYFYHCTLNLTNVGTISSVRAEISRQSGNYCIPMLPNVDAECYTYVDNVNVVVECLRGMFMLAYFTWKVNGVVEYVHGMLTWNVECLRGMLTSASAWGEDRRLNKRATSI